MLKTVKETAIMTRNYVFLFELFCVLCNPSSCFMNDFTHSECFYVIHF
jgi:hypothetical protein